MSMADKINREVARQTLDELLVGVLPSVADRTPVVKELLDTASIKLQARAGKLVLTFDVSDDDDDELRRNVIAAGSNDNPEETK